MLLDQAVTLVFPKGERIDVLVEQSLVDYVEHNNLWYLGFREQREISFNDLWAKWTADLQALVITQTTIPVKPRVKARQR